MLEDNRATADDFEEEAPSTPTNNASTTTTSRLPKGGKTNDAFAELMKPKPKLPAHPREPDKRTQQTRFMGRDGLAAYTTNPASFPRDRVVQYDDDFVVIRDLYPKATIHLLILPRDAEKNIHRGQEAFDDVAFLERCQTKEKEVRDWVAEELRSKFGKVSVSELARRQAMEADAPPANGELPPGRDWEREVISGVHAIPSMNHLHIHVLSRDMMSGWMKKSNHYLSFTTEFLIPLDAFPMDKGDWRRQFGHWSDADMKCWRCGLNLGSGAPGMRRVKAHLKEEFEEWKEE
ncbi:HIT-like protein [Polychaeton citri CBS 116435]|uniref:HIT-like protein n=1 Tax=Polychaeton citri CBS 116435 TaxID=1314669 RepID=A0A9P4QHH3_9PEZI|nr:HIT-like protein [Polychaeton citri CBS 116435]